MAKKRNEWLVSAEWNCGRERFLCLLWLRNSWIAAWHLVTRLFFVFSQTLRLRLWLNSVGSTSRFCLYYECGKLCLSLTKGKQIFGYSFVLCVVVAYLYGLNFSILDAITHILRFRIFCMFSSHGLPYIVTATNRYFLKYTTNNGITPNKAALLLRYACR
jgi:hypothetical protein